MLKTQGFTTETRRLERALLVLARPGGVSMAPRLAPRSLPAFTAFGRRKDTLPRRTAAIQCPYAPAHAAPGPGVLQRLSADGSGPRSRLRWQTARCDSDAHRATWQTHEWPVAGLCSQAFRGHVCAKDVPPEGAADCGWRWLRLAWRSMLTTHGGKELACRDSGHSSRLTLRRCGITSHVSACRGRSALTCASAARRRRVHPPRQLWSRFRRAPTQTGRCRAGGGAGLHFEAVSRVKPGPAFRFNSHY